MNSRQLMAMRHRLKAGARKLVRQAMRDGDPFSDDFRAKVRKLREQQRLLVENATRFAARKIVRKAVHAAFNACERRMLTDTMRARVEQLRQREEARA